MPNNQIYLLFLAFSLTLCEYIKYDGSKLIPLSHSPNEDYNASEIVSTNTISQEMLSYYSWFASYGYCEDIEVPLFCCITHLKFFNEKWTIVSESSIEHYYDYNFVLWRSDEYKKYIIAVPGTRNSILELLREAINTQLVEYSLDDSGEEDINEDTDDDNGIKLVNYFYKVAKKVKDIIFTTDVLADIADHSDYQFVFTGHSLGASVASILLYDAVNRNYINKVTNNPAFIGFGMPRTGNKNWVTDFNSKIKNILRVVRDGDIVTSLPYLPINNPYKHLGGLILVNKEMTSMNYCPKDIGEDYTDDECIRSIIFETKYHSYYFNPNVSFSTRCEEN